jgi:hypothetical protein
MYEEERDSRMHGNVEYATKNYQLVLEKRELEKKNLELHKQLGNTLEHVAELTNHNLELEKAKREKAEQEVACLKEEKKKVELVLAALKEEKKKLELVVATLKEEKEKGEQQAATLKDEKRKVEYYVSDLLNALHVQKDKMKKIAAMCAE